MIITQKKPLEEVLALVGEAKTVAVIGCGLCASTCQTGGAPEVEAMKKTLEEAGKITNAQIADELALPPGRSTGPFWPRMPSRPPSQTTAPSSIPLSRMPRRNNHHVRYAY